MNAETLIRTLRAYDASIDAAAVRTALSDPKSADLVRWAAVHVTPDTLLTVDELNQYAALEDSGLAEKLAMSSDVTAAHILSDQEIKDAIRELNRSTQAITRHTELLKQQQEALDRLVESRLHTREERAVIEAGQARKWQAGRSDVASRVDELSHSIHSRILELGQQSNGAGPTIQQTVDTLFRSDDKLLSSLQKLGWELETESPEEEQDVAMLRETCARLIKFTVEGIRAKLDRIYLESLEISSQTGATTRVAPDEVSALQEELESLYAEILPVAQMTTEQQFLEPALKSLAAKSGQELARSAQATSYIHECLDYLIDRSQDLMARLEAYHGYQLAANAVLDITKSELETSASADVATPPPRQKSGVQQDAMSPVRPRPKQRSRYSTGAPGINDEPPLDELLRTLAISLPQGEDVPADLQAQIKELASTVAGRRAKVQHVARNAQETFEHVAMKQLADGKLAIGLVHDSILAESQFGDVRLVDPEIEGSIDVLSQELATVDEKLRGVDASVARLRGRNARRDELVSRWGS